MNNGNYTDTLKQPGFFALLLHAVLGAFNDNFLKIVVSFVALNLGRARRSDFYVELIAFFLSCRRRCFPVMPAISPTCIASGRSWWR